MSDYAAITNNSSWPVWICNSVTVASVSSHMFNDGDILSSAKLNDLADRIAALEGKAPIARVVREVEQIRQIHRVREVTVQIPADPQIVIINGWVPVAIAAVILAKRVASWVVATYQRGKAMASFQACRSPKFEENQ